MLKQIKLNYFQKKKTKIKNKLKSHLYNIIMTHILSYFSVKSNNVI